MYVKQGPKFLALSEFHLMLSSRARPEQRSFGSLSCFTTVSGSKDIETFCDFVIYLFFHIGQTKKCVLVCPERRSIDMLKLSYDSCFREMSFVATSVWSTSRAFIVSFFPGCRSNTNGMYNTQPLHIINQSTPAAALNLLFFFFCTQRSFHTALCLPFQKPFESSIFSKISCLLGATGKHCSETSSFARAICFIHHTDPQPRMRKRERVSPHLLWAPRCNPSVLYVPWPRNRLHSHATSEAGIKNTAAVPTGTRALNFHRGGGTGLWVDEFTPTAPQLCSHRECVAVVCEVNRVERFGCWWRQNKKT